MAPQRSKYVMKFNVNSTERQKTSHEHLRRWGTEPRCICGNLTGKTGGATRSIEIRRQLPPKYSTTQGKRECNKSIESSDYKNSNYGQSSG
mmetsp:Transcript_22567/g.58783  ORF Transcript_22567/g.58783 Transcript_22567/m.58783 type:complete len:91 (-) Transcript_22567:1192-1464(-)